MAMFILDDATGIGSDDLNTIQAFVDLVFIANDDGIGLDDPVGGMQRVTYNRTLDGPPQFRLDTLVNTDFSPDYGDGAAQVDIVIIPALDDFVLDDGTVFTNNGTALSPQGSGEAGSSLNTTDNCLVIYDTQQNICVARDGTDGTLDLPITNAGVLYHELSHAFRILNNSLLEITPGCDPSSPEENAAIIDENDYRTQLANELGETPELRDPNNHCGQVCPSGGGGNGCCIIASLASGSPISPQVQGLRAVRDHFVRRTEVGYAFCERFFRDYSGFSPPVCTLMAGQPVLTRQLMDGYVVPLLCFWQMMISRSQRSDAALAAESGNEIEQWLGQCFARHHPSLEQASERLQALDRTRVWWNDGAGPGNLTESEVPEALYQLLRERAWTSDYIQWALIRPLQIYYRLLACHIRAREDRDGAVLRVGRLFREAIEEWAPQVPIAPVWGALSAEEVSRELSFCYRALFQSPGSRRNFAERLWQAFPGVTAVEAAINDEPAFTGDV